MISIKCNRSSTMIWYRLPGPTQTVLGEASKVVSKKMVHNSKTYEVIVLMHTVHKRVFFFSFLIHSEPLFSAINKKITKVQNDL